jgi:hypothetical protein
MPTSQEASTTPTQPPEPTGGEFALCLARLAADVLRSEGRIRLLIGAGSGGTSS